MVSLSKTASCSIIIVGSLLASLWASQIGSADAIEISDTASLSFTVSVPHSASPSIIGNDEENYEWENENKKTGNDAVARQLKKRMKKQRNKGGSKTKRKYEDDSSGESRTIFDTRLEECIQMVLDESSATRTDSTESPETRAPDSNITNTDDEETDEEEIVFIRSLSEGPDGLLYSRDGATCDQEITEEMQELVSKHEKHEFIVRVKLLFAPTCTKFLLI